MSIFWLFTRSTIGAPSSMPWKLMVVYLVAALFVGVFAAIIPAVRAARLNVLGAIAYE